MNVAANRHGGDWDLPKLQDVIAGLEQQGIDFAITGFDPEDIAAMPDFEPIGEEPPRLDQKAPVTCPECGHEFQA